MTTTASPTTKEDSVDITIVLEDKDGRHHSTTINALDQESLETIAIRVAERFNLEPSEVIEGLGTGEIAFSKHDSLVECTRHGKSWECRRRQTCVEVHYQSEDPARHFFNPNSPWRVAHEWACRHFKVASAVCQDLELFAGSPTGPPLNETLPIGASHECKIVWLAKPGPEPNGCQ
jgi:hypothetical protein